MKKFIIPTIAAVLFVSLSACTTVEEKRGPSSHSSTTTTEATLHSPISATSTTETRSTRY